MAKITSRIDKSKRLMFSDDYIEGLNRDNLFLCEDDVRIRRRGIFRFIDLGKISYRTLNFLKVTENLSETPELAEQVYSSKSRHVKFDDKNRILLKDNEIDHAGIRQECIMIRKEVPRSDSSKPYIGIWNPKNWEKYSRYVKNNYFV